MTYFSLGVYYFRQQSVFVDDHPTVVGGAESEERG
jgi:hypothetical protein